MDFSLFHEPNLSDPNPQTADIKSGYRGRESRTREKGRDLTQSCDKNPYTHKTMKGVIIDGHHPECYDFSFIPSI